MPRRRPRVGSAPQTRRNRRSLERGSRHVGTRGYTWACQQRQKGASLISIASRAQRTRERQHGSRVLGQMCHEETKDQQALCPTAGLLTGHTVGLSIALLSEIPRNPVVDGTAIRIHDEAKTVRLHSVRIHSPSRRNRIFKGVACA